MLKSKRRKFEVKEDGFYQMLVRRNGTNSNGNSQHIKAGITTTVAVLENLKKQKDPVPYNEEKLKTFCGLRFNKTAAMRISNLISVYIVIRLIIF